MPGERNATTRFLLLRHGSTDSLVQSIAGWDDTVALNAQGRCEIERLGAELRKRSVAAIYASPVARTRQSAELLAACLGVDVHLSGELAELDFGDWTGKNFAELNDDPHWQRFNAFRSGTRIPNGETMLETLARAVALLLRLRDDHASQCVALVTHGDVIRALLSHFLGMPLDFFARLEVGPASLSELELGLHHVRVLSLNQLPVRE